MMEATDDGDSLSKIIVHYADSVMAAKNKARYLESCLS